MAPITNHDQILGVEIRHLVALEAIARTQSFSQAAASLGYAQSAISQQIATLEKAVGQRLIERPGGRRPVSLTPAGEIVLRHAEHIAARVAAMSADLQAFAGGEVGTLRIGVFQSVSAKLLPATLAAFRTTWPRIEIELRNTYDTDELAALVGSGEIDVAFADLTTVTDPLVGRKLLDDPYVVLAPAGSPIAAESCVDWTALEGADLIAQSETDSCAIHVEQALAAAGVHTRVVFRSDENIAVQRLVAAGAGYAVMPLLAVELDAPGLDAAIVPLCETSRLARHIGVVWHRDRYLSPVTTAFIEAAESAATDAGTVRQE
jgi:DNA-binding transcriptional LysR family regulator